VPGDLREPDFLTPGSVDVLVCQRVIINLLDRADQTAAVDNLIRTVAPRGQGRGGRMLFIEAFETPLATLNVAREEFDMPPIPPAHHNLYLPDHFLERPGLAPLGAPEGLPAPNFLSSHYYITRVMQPMLTRGKPLKRNSEFVRFFSRAVAPGVGDYSPVKLYMFERV
jgi:hypothetical protein